MCAARVCSNHDTIPHYQSINPLIENTHRSKPSIDWTNGELSKLTPKGQTLAKTVGMIAAAFLPLISALFLRSKLLNVLSVLSCVLMCGFYIIEYKNYKNEVSKLEKEISSLFKEYSEEFVFLEQKYAPLITLKDDEFNLIKPFCTEWHPLQYQIREETHFKFNGGDIGAWSVTPLTLQEVCKVTNSEKVIEKYKPWIDLLIALAKHEKIDANFLLLVGKMGGFKRSLMDFTFYDGGQYSCIYKSNERHIACQHKTDKNKNCIITTPEECLAFAEREFLQN